MHLGRELSVTIKLSRQSKKSSSRITLYIEYARSDIHPQLGFHCISSCLGNDAKMLLEHLTCVTEFKEV